MRDECRAGGRDCVMATFSELVSLYIVQMDVTEASGYAWMLYECDWAVSMPGPAAQWRPEQAYCRGLARGKLPYLYDMT